VINCIKPRIYTDTDTRCDRVASGLRATNFLLPPPPLLPQGGQMS
jgi:hypothetical protein